MSLINDALRRANAEAKPRPSQQSAPVPPLQPVDSRPPGSSMLPWAVLLLGVGVLAIAAAMWFRGTPSKPQLAENRVSSVAANDIPAPAESSIVAPAASPEKSAEEPPPTTPVASDQIQPRPAQLLASSDTASRPASITAPAPQAVAPPPVTTPEPTQVAPEKRVETANTSIPAFDQTKAAPPVLPAMRPAEVHAAKPGPARLQAIYYRMRNPSVVINGKTMAPGQTVDGIKVVSIQRTSVEILQNGKYRTLTLQD